MNTTVSDSPQVLSRKGDPITGDTYSGQDDSNDINSEIKCLEKSLEVAKMREDWEEVFNLMNQIEGLCGV